ncbi:cytochrome P450 6g1-like [Haematobia irritans]|uniref:cytochrome P450 6g1-like n=1 Tax=Haematobia irritans TaxID=7368 RepID=UPI003F50C31F
MCLSIVLLLTALSLLLGYVSFKIQFGFWQRHRNIPSVPGKIFSGNFLDFVTFKTNFGYHLKTIYDDAHFKDKPVVGVYGLFKPSLLIRDPELIKAVLIKDFDSFHNRYVDIDASYDTIGGQMMFFSSYELWKEMRYKLSPVFSGAKLKQMFPLIQNVAENMAEYLKRLHHQVTQIEMKDFCARYTTDVIATTLLGLKSNCLENPEEHLNTAIRRMTEFGWKRGLNFVIIAFAPQFMRLFKSKILYPDTNEFLRNTIFQAIRERETSGEKRYDLIDIFVKLKEEASHNNTKDMKMFMECLAAQAGVFMVGGFETSSTTMANALLELAKHPDIQEKLKKEIHMVLKEENSSQISPEAINKIDYLEMIINETLRLYPVSPILERKYYRPEGKTEQYSLKPYCDFSLPDGMSIFISVYGLHYDAEYWLNPTKFDPERFSSTNRESINPMVYLPFGMGPRNCFGARLAMFQVKCGLFYLLKDHHVRLCADTVLQPEFDAKAIVLQMKGGLYLEVVRDKK